ncbi:uncharacterized protein BT62DRAFT_927272 [Guyanagaster necrorhizus]|uniref:Uncharacterized protein n=1 Tax=Guyanagaster necrorhizus TaxID=856835 RepID=A0A9P7W3R1_9AGAR|nr:uncharacterized protein BT62DRAFT_927272 [Guyanagaster necrorhizus MCA 3950]KAG7451559.1 hypothetical protein BT62DRAFT_927272 [Guyanagaster necrorhizus MCA 3950]
MPITTHSPNWHLSNPPRCTYHPGHAMIPAPCPSASFDGGRMAVPLQNVAPSYFYF